MNAVERVGQRVTGPQAIEALTVERGQAAPDAGQRQPLLKDDGKPDRGELEEVVTQINKTLEIYRTEVRFAVHEASGEMMVKVINAETSEVIREIPPEQVLNIVADVKKMLGVILDKFI